MKVPRSFIAILIWYHWYFSSKYDASFVIYPRSQSIKTGSFLYRLYAKTAELFVACEIVTLVKSLL